MAGLERRDVVVLAVGAALVAAAGAARYSGAPSLLAFAVAGIAIAALAHLVGGATEQLGTRLGPGGAGTVQSALGNLPELFISLFALHDGLVRVVQAALVGSILANGLLVLGIAFAAGGLKHGVQRFDSSRARTIATLTVLAATTLSVPSLTAELHAPAAAHERTLSLVCAGVLLAVFLVTLRAFLGGSPEEGAVESTRWPLATTLVVLGSCGAGAAVVSDWFVAALQPAIATLHMSQDFAGLVIVAIAGNAVENVVGVQLARANRPDFAIAVIVNSALQVALALTPVLVFVSLLFATPLTLAFPVLLAVALLFAAWVAAIVVYDGESTWEEGAVLVGLYLVIAASFWWGA